VLDTELLPYLTTQYTTNGKKVELAVRQVLHSQPVVNVSSLRNPATLDQFKEHPAILQLED
jgi:acetoacetyl-CoA synthetase